MAKKTGKKSKGFFGRMFKSPEPPTLTGTTPDTGQFDPEAFASIFLQFDKPIDKSTLGIAHAGAFIIKDGLRQPLPGQIGTDDKGSKVAFSPSDKFPFSAELEIHLEKGFKAADGGVLKDEIVLKFKTTDAPPPAKAVVFLKKSGFIPGDGAKEVSVDLSPAIVFDKEIDPESIKDAKVFNLSTQNSGDLLPAQTRIGHDPTILYLTPEKPFKEGENYQLVVLGGEKGIKSKEGNFLENDLQLQFSTLGQSAESASLETSISEKPAEPGDFQDEKSLSEVEPATLPESPPPLAETKEADLKADPKAPGIIVKEVAEPSIEVETVEEPPVDGGNNVDFLILKSSNPEPGANGVSLKIKPSLAFPVPLNLVSITYGLQVKLISQNRTELVPGFVIPKQDLTVIEIMPKMPLEAESEYEIQLVAGAEGIRSGEEKALEKPVSITFTTGKS